MVSAHETVDYFVKANNITEPPVTESLPDTNPADGSTVTITTYSGGTDGTEVVYCEMAEAGHGWPGHEQHGWVWQRIVGKKNLDFDGAARIWEFFERHTR